MYHRSELEREIERQADTKKLLKCRKFLEDLAESNAQNLDCYYDDSKAILQFLDTLDQET